MCGHQMGPFPHKPSHVHPEKSVFSLCFLHLGAESWELLATGGITATAATQFHRGNFIVVLVSIEQIDLRKMLQSRLDEKQMKRFDQVRLWE